MNEEPKLQLKEHLNHYWTIKYPSIGKWIIYCDCGTIIEHATLRHDEKRKD